MQTHTPPLFKIRQLILKNKIIKYFQKVYDRKKRAFVDYFQVLDLNEKAESLFQIYKQRQKKIIGWFVLILLILSHIIAYLYPAEMEVAKMNINHTVPCPVNGQGGKIQIMTEQALMGRQRENNQSLQIKNNKKSGKELIQIEEIGYKNKVSEDQQFLIGELVKTEIRLAQVIKQIQPQIISFNSVAIYKAKHNLKCQKEYGQKHTEVCKIQEENSYIKKIPQAPHKSPLGRETINSSALNNQLYKVNLFPFIHEHLTSPKKMTWLEKMKQSLLGYYKINNSWNDLYLMIQEKTDLISTGRWQSDGNKLTVGSYMINNSLHPWSYNLRLFVPTMFYLEFPYETPSNHTLEIFGTRLGYDKHTKIVAPIYKNKLGSFQVQKTLNEQSQKKSVKRVIFCQSMDCNLFYTMITIQSNNPLSLYGFKIYTSVPID